MLLPLTFLLVLATVRADFPVECHFDDIVGQWVFYETERNLAPMPDCDSVGEFKLFII